MTKRDAPFQYIQTQEDLNALCKELKACKRLSLDTEADSLHSYFEKVCLIQLSFQDRHVIVDPLVNLDLKPFLDILQKKELIIHGADYDLRMMRQSFGFLPQAKVFDTMLAAQLLGFPKTSLAALVEKYFEIKLSKEGQKSNWSRRPLKDDLLRYASDDTRFLETICDKLQVELRKANRLDWHATSCKKVVTASQKDREKDPDQVWRVRGAGVLSPKELCYLKELWHWRDKEARKVDEPAFMIMTNEKLIALAKWETAPPAKRSKTPPRFPRNCKATRLSNLEKALEKAKAIPESEWPQHPRKTRTRQEDLKPQVDALKKECERIAVKLKVDAPVLAPVAVLRTIAKHKATTVKDIMACTQLMKWQAELLQPGFKKVLDGKA